MPDCFLEVPTGIRADAKKKLVQKITAALNETWPIPDVRVFFREYQAENVAQDGRLQAEPVRPVCFLNVPLLRSLDAKRKLTEKLHAAFAEAYEGIANTAEFMIFYNLYPRSEEHTSELQSLRHLVCRLLLEKKKQTK